MSRNWNGQLCAIVVLSDSDGANRQHLTQQHHRWPRHRAFARLVVGVCLGGCLIVMPSNSSGWFWTALARETGRLGHLYSPGGFAGPWPWFPYALDNGAYACWDKKRNVFDHDRWAVVEQKWQRLIVWAQVAAIKPMWMVVPDVPGDSAATFERWARFAPTLTTTRLALAVQDGMTTEQVRALLPAPSVIAVGGSDEFKWSTVGRWAADFPRVHVLRCNSPERLYELDEMGVESCDGTGWNRGDRKQTAGVEKWARSCAKLPITTELWPYVCREPKDKKQESFA